MIYMSVEVYYTHFRSDISPRKKLMTEEVKTMLENIVKIPAIAENYKNYVIFNLYYESFRNRRVYSTKIHLKG